MSELEHDAPAAAPEPVSLHPAGDETPSGLDAARQKILAELPAQVTFDGWSRGAIDAAAEAADVPVDVARMAFPKPIDAAAAFHRRGDRLMIEALAGEPLSSVGMTQRITRAIRLRLELAEPDREAVRRATSLFALPTHASLGARLVWGTADAIWTALGDESRDLNWYSKRATLAGVFSSTVLYWLADESEGRAETWAFLDRRIADVMKIEKTKAAIRRNPLGKAALSGMDLVARNLRAPGKGSKTEDSPTG